MILYLTIILMTKVWINAKHILNNFHFQRILMGIFKPSQCEIAHRLLLVSRDVTARSPRTTPPKGLVLLSVAKLVTRLPDLAAWEGPLVIREDIW